MERSSLCFEWQKCFGLGAFKTHFSIWFFNGVFLKDVNKLLSAVTDTTKGLRQMRFESISEIDNMLF